MSITVTKSKAMSFKTVDKGWQATEGGMIALIAIVVLVFVVSMTSSLFGKKDRGMESANTQAILTNASALKSSSGGYNYSSADEMTGALIKNALAPRGMTIQGDPSSGNAKLYNSWNGQVTVEPGTQSNGFSNTFALTYKGVPQDMCGTFASTIGSGALVSTVSINGNSYSSSDINLNKASNDCTITSNEGNTIIFNSVN